MMLLTAEERKALGVDPDRRTGRTTNQLRECVARARAGEAVVFIVRNRGHVRLCAMPSLIDVVLAGAADWLLVGHGRPSVRFDSGGSIAIVGMEDELSIRGSVAIIRDHACDDRWPAEPPAPTCRGPLATHGTPVVRVRLGALSPSYFCDPCYLHLEAMIAKRTSAMDDSRRPGLSAWIPPARVGTVPQSIGPGAGIGIWASRGMRSR